MKVLQININYISSKLHQVMIDKLNNRDIENIVFNPVYDSELLTMMHDSNVIICKCFKYSDRYLYFLKQSKIFNALQKAIDFDSIDYIHTYTLFSDGNQAYKLGKKYGIPYITTVRDTDIYGFLKYKPYLIFRAIQIMRHARAVIFLSNPYKEYMMDKICFNITRRNIEKKSIVLKNGIDDYWLDNSYLNKDYTTTYKRFEHREISIICVARIVPQKNIQTVQQAVDILNKRGWKTNLTVIGRDDNKKLLDEVQRHKYTVYKQPVPKEELINYYRNADVFALVSHRETFGLVYAEAMSQGLPVIYTKGQGFDGKYEQGEVGYAVSDNDPAEIAKAILMICDQYQDI